MSLLFQFKRAANIYFLIITILTCLPTSPKSPQTQIATFAFMLLVTMLKEAWEDSQRAKSDNEMNTRKAQVLDNETKVFKECKWADIKLGDLVRVEKDQEIPADLLLINSVKDIVFVSTMNLDGETNLKDRELVLDTVTNEKLPEFQGKVTYDEANPSLDHWQGKLESPNLGKPRACDIKNLLLRGCTLKNTPYCVGICLYVGNETKIMMNQKKAPTKISNMMHTLNKMLYSVFFFQFCILVVWSTMSVLWMKGNKETHLYLDIQGEVNAGRWFLQYVTYQVAYSHMIPISLYVIIEILKICLGKSINRDVKMFFAEEDDMNYALTRNSDLIEELG